MAGPGSQNATTRDPRRHAGRTRRVVISVLGGLAFVAAVMAAIDALPETELGRSVDAHLTRLADPRSWIP